MRTVLALALAVILTTLPLFAGGRGACAEEEAPVVRAWHALFDDGWDLLEAGDLDEALELFQRAYAHALEHDLTANALEALLARPDQLPREAMGLRGPPGLQRPPAGGPAGDRRRMRTS